MLFFESSYLLEHSPDPNPTRVLHDAFVVAHYSDLIRTFKLCSLFYELRVDNLDPKSSVGLSSTVSLGFAVSLQGADLLLEAPILF
jgi:hypothetical protein